MPFAHFVGITSAMVVSAAVFRHKLGGRNYLRCAVRTITEIHSGKSKVWAALSWFIEPVQQDDEGVGRWSAFFQRGNGEAGLVSAWAKAGRDTNAVEPIRPS